MPIHMRKKSDKRQQKTMGFMRRGGKRQGAGRKPKGAKAGVSHGARQKLSRHYPVHVTVRLGRGLPRLRNKKALRVLKNALSAGSDRFGFRLAHFSVQANHLHLICEANNQKALSRGMQGLSIRVAKGLNRLWQRKGRVFADRYHARILRTPREVRNALCYVLNNARRHARRLGKALLDPFSSGFWFNGWKETRGREPPGVPGAKEDPPLARATTWLLTKGWRRRGLIGMGEVPG